MAALKPHARVTISFSRLTLTPYARVRGGQVRGQNGQGYEEMAEETLSQTLSLSLSRSLSHKHTHTHTHPPPPWSCSHSCPHFSWSPSKSSRKDACVPVVPFTPTCKHRERADR